jgi:hypothetical protein
MSAPNLSVRGYVPNEKEDIADRSLRQRYAFTFTVITSLFVILLLGVVVGMGYLITVIYDKETNQTEKIMSIVIPVLLLLIVIGMSVFYFLYIRKDLENADKIATDILRITTNPMTDSSFKNNLTNLVSGRLGINDEKGRNRIFNNIASSMVVDPRSYIESLAQNKGIEKISELSNAMKEQGFGRTLREGDGFIQGKPTPYPSA